MIAKGKGLFGASGVQGGGIGRERLNLNLRFMKSIQSAMFACDDSDHCANENPGSLLIAVRGFEVN